MLVFIHGSGCTGDVFASQVTAFPGSRALDLPGHTTPGEPSSVAEFADAVDLECAALHDVVLVGNSLGGAIALELALRKRPWLRAVVLIGSGAKLRVSPAILEGLAGDFPAAARRIAQYFFAEPLQERVDAAVAEMLRVGQAQTLRDFQACNAFDVTERLAGITVPLLAITGEKDVMTPPKFAAFLADRVPGATARILPGAGHLAMVERPDDTNEALRAFVTHIES
ncbi:MAG TPA: alpha/beta fold hydrolase [Candidatus Baltobacteraceae bacterium]|jgi:pimeloyl-ACP methyl ester carboxylesterase|nr:alpha/beta fold hydrolase [Candidatus Baltobacteraceae bacterium]